MMQQRRLAFPDKVSETGIPDRLGVIGARLLLWHQRHRTRQQLNRLNEQGLLDIGVSTADRQVECAKWFWQP
jgi:uncharacterized protein YjiS (DUF1127 family)